MLLLCSTVTDEYSSCHLTICIAQKASLPCTPMRGDRFMRTIFILSIHLEKIVVNNYVNRSIPQNTAHTYNCIHLRGTYNN